jgi:urease accessory protein
MVAVETGIATSAIVLGLMVALAARPPLWTAALLVGAFAIFHGYAHASEAPASATMMPFALGFVAATIVLHLAGIAVGSWSERLAQAGQRPMRILGSLITAAGAALLIF